MTLYISEDIKPYFHTQTDLFDQMMALRGECFRKQPGRLTQRITLGEKTYFIKQHTGVGWKEIIKNISQGRLPVLGAKNEWQALTKLQQLGVKAPKVIAYGQRGWNPAKRQSFIIMEALAPTTSLETLCQPWQQHSPTFAFKWQLLREMADMASRLHENGMNHRDFYLCHFLLHAHDAHLYLIDLHRTQLRLVTPKRWLIKDLAGLYFSSKDIGLTQRDLFRFMKRYRHTTLRDLLTREKTFWQQVKWRGEQLYREHI